MKIAIYSFKARLKSRALRYIGTVTHVIGPRDAIALTFDDGPEPTVTPAILDVLKTRNAKATFFLLCDHAGVHRAIVQRMLDEGHQVGLHFDRHDRITDLRPLTALRRMAQAHRTLVHLAGPTSLFRPPYGGQNHLTYFFARLLGLTVVTWNRSADDWIQQSAESAAQRATQGLTGGDVVLMHDGLELKPGEPVIDIDRPAMVDSFLQQAAARGLRSVTVGDLLSRGVPSRTRWIR